jgi:Protein of unknown function (DUF2934)
MEVHMQELEQAIRERAYHLWVADGRHDGNADAHWLTAQREVLASSLSSIARVRVSEAEPANKPATRKKAKATTTKSPTTKRKSKAA